MQTLLQDLLLTLAQQQEAEQLVLIPDNLKNHILNMPLF